MKHILVTLFLVILSNISSAQTGWGYVNYTSYKTHNGNGSTNQYTQFANNSAGFDAMFNTANSNTTITHKGETPLASIYDGSWQVPRWNSDFFGYKFEFWFVPQQTGTYRFGINSDDASDLSVNGTIISTYYGGHGASGYQIGTINLVAGTSYKVVARMQEYGGGEAFYLNWSRPSAPNTYSYWTNEVTNIESIPTKKAVMNFDFGTTLDKTKFLVGANPLSAIGSIDITNSLDTLKVANGVKASTTAGQVEWCVIYEYDASNQRYRVGIDSREVNGIVSEPTTITNLQLFDLWNGPVTFNSYDPNGWTEVYINTPTQFNFTTSSFSQNIRAGNGFYGLQAEFSFSPILKYNSQSVIITTTNNLVTMYNSIVTVSDVFLAFKELSNGGLFGNQSGLEFTSGIQYKNADVNNDGVFNEEDTYRLLEHLTGKKNLVDLFTLDNILKLIPKETYNTITKSNWSAFPSYLSNGYSFDINTGNVNDIFDISATWKGDVNLSHSAQQNVNVVGSNSVRSMSLMSNLITNEVNVITMGEIVGNKIIITLSVDPLQQELVGTQFQLNYDNTKLKFDTVEFTTKGNPINYGTNKDSFINIGSLITNGNGVLDNTTEYKVIFTPISNITNILGLTSISATDAVNLSGNQLKIKIK